MGKSCSRAARSRCSLCGKRARMEGAWSKPYRRSRSLHHRRQQQHQRDRWSSNDALRLSLRELVGAREWHWTRQADFSVGPLTPRLHGAVPPKESSVIIPPLRLSHGLQSLSVLHTSACPPRKMPLATCFLPASAGGCCASSCVRSEPLEVENLCPADVACGLYCATPRSRCGGPSSHRTLSAGLDPGSARAVSSAFLQGSQARLSDSWSKYTLFSKGTNRFVLKFLPKRNL
jgi:hypothetical protein